MEDTYCASCVLLSSTERPFIGDLTKMSSKNLAEVDPVELKVFLDSFDNVLCDCDGTLWRLGNPIRGVPETLSKLRELEKNIRFVTNNSLNTLKNFCIKLNNFQFGAQIEDIAFPTIAIIDYLKKANFNKEIYVLGSPSMVKEFIDAGFVVKTVEDRTFNHLDDFRVHLDDDGNVGAVIADLDVNVNYFKLIKAIVYLRRPEVLYITAGTDSNIPVEDNTYFPGPKHFQSILENLTKRMPIGIGKPDSNFNDFIIEKFKITDPSRTLFVGDSLRQDVWFAKKSGYKSLLTLSGVSILDDLLLCKNEDWMPEYYLESFGDLHELIKSKLHL